jgi:hypothetical protein
LIQGLGFGEIISLRRHPAAHYPLPRERHRGLTVRSAFCDEDIDGSVVTITLPPPESWWCISCPRVLQARPALDLPLSGLRSWYHHHSIT